MLVGAETVDLLDAGNFLGAKCSTVSLSLACHLAANANDSVEVHENRLVRGVACFDQGCDNGSKITAPIHNVDHLPTACPHFGIDVLCVGEVHRAITGDLVVVVHDNQIVEFEVAGQRNSLQGHTLL